MVLLYPRRRVVLRAGTSTGGLGFVPDGAMTREWHEQTKRALRSFEREGPWRARKMLRRQSPEYKDAVGLTVGLMMLRARQAAELAGSRGGGLDGGAPGAGGGGSGSSGGAAGQSVTEIVRRVVEYDWATMEVCRQTLPTSQHPQTTLQLAKNPRCNFLQMAVLLFPHGRCRPAVTAVRTPGWLRTCGPSSAPSLADGPAQSRQCGAPPTPRTILQHAGPIITSDSPRIVAQCGSLRIKTCPDRLGLCDRPSRGRRRLPSPTSPTSSSPSRSRR